MNAQKTIWCARATCPQRSCERIVRGSRQAIVESLFPGYLFIALAENANWAPLRSTRGVNRLVGFGGMPLKVGERFIEHLQHRCENTVQSALRLGDSVRITAGDFAELDAIFMAMDGDERAILLLNILNRQQRVSVLRRPTVNRGAVACLNEVKPLASGRYPVRP